MSMLSQLPVEGKELEMGGHRRRVFLNLCAGLKRIGVPY